MVEFTVGPVTGDYADWGTAWDYLVGLGALADDYNFRQVENCVINNSWNQFSVVDCNGHSVRFYVPEAARHGGNPNAGLVTNLVGVNGVINMQFTNTTIADNVYVDGLNVQKTDFSAIVMMLFGSFAANTEINFNITNNILKGFSTGEGTGIKFRNNMCLPKVSNLKIFHIRTPFDGVFSVALLVDRPDTHYAENVVVDDFGLFGFSVSNLPGVSQGHEWTFKNCVAVGGNGNPAANPTGWLNPGAGPTRIKAFNCADTDGSLSTAVWIDRTDCISNIVAADEFASLVDTDNDYLFLKLGAVTADWTREPAGNVNVGDVIKFDPEVTITPGATVLHNSGIAPTLQSVDITGQAIPNSQGEYPIGAHIQEYST